MPRLSRPPKHLPVALGWVLLLSLSATVGSTPRAADTWRACQDRVIAGLESAGVRNFGSVSAYTGATGAGTQDAVIERCGYHPERIDLALCDELYQQVYPNCREAGFEGMSMAAHSWVLIFDPAGPLVGRLRRVCGQPVPVTRTAFGGLVCGD